ncbi:PocR ligand-binding domain-containing protein [bacterium]|nr:PocR ligand-binding domain-containing protein [bacterium]
MLISLAGDPAAAVSSRDTVRPNQAGSPGNWLSFPFEASHRVYGECRVLIADPVVFPEVSHLLSTVAGLAALRIEHLQLSGIQAIPGRVPDGSGTTPAAGPSAAGATGQVAQSPRRAGPPRRDDEDATAAKAAFEVSENLYQLIALYSSDSIWAMDANLKFTYLSPSTERLFGFTIQEWETLAWDKFVHPKDLDAVNQIYSGLTDGSERASQSAVIRVFHKNGREMWVEFTASPVHDRTGQLQAVVGVTRDITNRKQTEIALEQRVLALTQPLDDPRGLAFEDLFNIDEIQALQDEFAAATGVASIITSPDGTPITKPSQFTRLCSEIIRKTGKGCANCYQSDAIIGAPKPDGPLVQPCLSGGLWDAGASISVGGRHIANWLIGQVRDETQTEDAMLAYARVIGADEREMLTAFREVPSMSRKQFEQVAQALVTLANQLSTMAYQNVLQARFISERKQVEEQLRASELAHRSLIVAMPDVVMRYDREGRHLFVSDNVGDFADYRAEDFLGKTHREMGFPEEMCEFWERHLKIAFETGQPVESEFEIPGTTVILNWRVVPEKDEEGNVQSLLSLARDVTAQRQAERDYQLLFREMSEGFVLLDVVKDETGKPVDFSFLALNPSFERMTGIYSTDIAGKSMREVVSAKEQANVDVLVRVTQTGIPEKFTSENLELGTYFEVTAFRPVPGQVACILMDVTARKRAEADRLKMERQIQHAQKLESLGVLAGGIAHDFNNILFAILGNSSLALETLAADHPARSMIEEIAISGERASGLVRQILTFARRTERQRNNLDIVPLVKEVTKLMRATLPSNVVIHLELGTEHTAIFADTSEIHQILMNLCTNAGYVMQAEGGSLILRLHNHCPAKPLLTESIQPRADRYYLIEVQDTGPGIPPDIQERMFDPFYTTKPVGEGTGMGLALVQSITTELGGWIEVETAIGSGTTIRVYLPFAEKSDTTQQLARRRELPTGSEHVLVVDDEHTIASLLNRYLQKLGYQVSMFTSSLEAAAQFTAHPDDFDLAILDQTMPDLTGKDLAARFRQLRPDLPIIIATGYSSTFSADQAEELGIRHYLDKPVVLSDLAVIVREALDTPGA